MMLAPAIAHVLSDVQAQVGASIAKANARHQAHVEAGRLKIPAAEAKRARRQERNRRILAKQEAVRWVG